MGPSLQRQRHAGNSFHLLSTRPGSNLLPGFLVLYAPACFVGAQAAAIPQKIATAQRCGNEKKCGCA